MGKEIDLMEILRQHNGIIADMVCAEPLEEFKGVNEKTVETIMLTFQSD